MTAPWTARGELLIISYGGGVNSVAMLVGMYERGITPSLILFSDTGGEKPETYEHLATVSAWLESKNWPTITTVAVSDNPSAIDKTLEDSCLRLGFLPSIVYGFKKCSQRWKADPQRKYLNHWDQFKQARSNERTVWQAIGYDAGELHRSLVGESKTEFVFPLREWNWGRAECVDAITRHGIPIPVKSACFFCPSSKKREVLALHREHPDLFARAVQLERAADGKNTAVKGLGRHWSWEQLVQIDEAQGNLFHETVEIPCMCFDGDSDD